jgi:hypothetical protein
MSAAASVTAQMLALLSEDAVLARVLHGVYHRPTARAALPHLIIGRISSADWGTKDRAGCELRIELRHAAAAGPDDGLVAERIAALVPAMRGVTGEWEIVSARLIRSRSGHDRQGGWSQIFEVRCRCLEHR